MILLYKSAKLRALSAVVPYVPLALRALMPHASRALRAVVPHSPHALRALVLYVPRFLLTLVPYLPRANRLFCLTCLMPSCILRVSRLACLLPYMPWVWCASSQTCSRVSRVLCVVVPHVSCTFCVLGMLVARPLCALVLLVPHFLLNINDINTLYPLRIAKYVKNEFENLQKGLKIKVWKWMSWSWW